MLGHKWKAGALSVDGLWKVKALTTFPRLKALKRLAESYKCTYEYRYEGHGAVQVKSADCNQLPYSQLYRSRVHRRSSPSHRGLSFKPEWPMNDQQFAVLDQLTLSAEVWHGEGLLMHGESI